MIFRHRQKVLFKHCDPAGIVFYPRYFEMINDCIEAFFDVALGWPFEVLHKQGAVPTAQISASFQRPSRHGDMLDFTLKAAAPGRTSLALDFVVTCEGAPRLTAQSTLVNVDAQGRPMPWPDTLRTRLTQTTGGTP
ncbi:thioesterase family protein [Puniceibacterium sp. IMCC21224]|uniref:acyl-CoA thioesterase n=1 Tax=Puniceibacterium sp. IMCC21224 TaxID=1618204 RepID=UPI00065CCFF1|nr:acyl-CoA thioesterase [Puniceibacterium sp. IMCC21224]KMK67917.1 putative thioesterase [Puniceibacterium sp. IMCC21224]